MEKYNTDFLVRVIVRGFHESIWYKYCKEKKRFGITLSKAGIYKECFGNFLEDGVPENHTLRDGIVYENPKCILCYVDGSHKTYHFNSDLEAVEFSEKFTVGSNWVE